MRQEFGAHQSAYWNALPRLRLHEPCHLGPARPHPIGLFRPRNCEPPPSDQRPMPDIDRLCAHEPSLSPAHCRRLQERKSRRLQKHLCEPGNCASRRTAGTQSHHIRAQRRPRTWWQERRRAEYRRWNAGGSVQTRWTPGQCRVPRCRDSLPCPGPCSVAPFNPVQSKKKRSINSRRHIDELRRYLP